MSEPLKIMPLKVMAVVCHPADAIDGAGGTLCLHQERGDEVTVVVCPMPKNFKACTPTVTPICQSTTTSCG